MESDYEKESQLNSLRKVFALFSIYEGSHSIITIIIVNPFMVRSQSPGTTNKGKRYCSQVITGHRHQGAQHPYKQGTNGHENCKGSQKGCRPGPGYRDGDRILRFKNKLSG